MLFRSDIARTVADLLLGRGFHELAPLETVPVPNSRRIRYPLEVTARRDKSRWAVRSYSTDFDLVDPRRRALADKRWFSIGWGMEGEHTRDELLLAQAGDIGQEEAGDLTGVLLPTFTACAVPWSYIVRQERSHFGLRLAAVLGSAPKEHC